MLVIFFELFTCIFKLKKEIDKSEIFYIIGNKFIITIN